ncbi:SpoIIE family protein phosphatase [Streptacidiphilus jiangxiensis]|uniref:SpoIIE family protein phosphatase n=1 Tax=Streptacidiphilus jiangxiensis TaxID=235985 RepID=UPI001376C2E6|nr:SpoIIE family protein phosphatase [Streptacidiphilus jiangxiensis]
MSLPDSVRAARAGAFRWDLADGAIHWDQAVCDLVGVAPDDFDGRADAFFSALHASDAARLAAATAEVLERGGRYRNHYRIARRDGGERLIEERGEVVLGPDGRPARVIGLLLDRTDDGPDPGYAANATASLETAGRAQRVPARLHPVAPVDAPPAQSSDSFLLTITRALSRATTAVDIMRVLTDIARPALNAETLLIHLTPDGNLAGIGRRPLHEPQPESLHPLRPAAAAVMRRAVEQEQPVFVEGVSAPPPPGERPLVRSWAVLPLIAAGERIGGCIVGYHGVRRFDEQQRATFTALGGIVAQALGRALLFDAEHQRATELQRVMLPRRVPAVPDHTVATRYRPGTAGMEVGGDWYEVLELEPDGQGPRVGLVIGDVQGHSAHASGVMGQLRVALRAFAREGHDPAVVLERTGRLLAELDTGLFATCCYATLDTATGRLLAARAGHPLPVLTDAAGTPRELDLPGGPPLGIDPTASYPLSEHRLSPGDTLLLYTDGLIEDRAEHYDNSVRRLLGLLASHAPARPLESLADALVDARPHSSPARDDLALLLVRRDGGRGREELREKPPEADGPAR